MLQQLPEHGGGTSKKDRSTWLVSALLRMGYGCLTPTDMALSMCEMSVELKMSGASNPMTLLRMALLRVSLVIQGGEEERMNGFSRAFVFL